MGGGGGGGGGGGRGKQLGGGGGGWSMVGGGKCMFQMLASFGGSKGCYSRSGIDQPMGGGNCSPGVWNFSRFRYFSFKKSNAFYKSECILGNSKLCCSALYSSTVGPETSLIRACISVWYFCVSNVQL